VFYILSAMKKKGARRRENKSHYWVSRSLIISLLDKKKQNEIY